MAHNTDGDRVLIDRVTLTGVLFSTLAFSTAYGVLLVLPLYLTTGLHGSEADYGVLTASATVTAILSLVLLIRFPNRLPPNYLFAAAAALYALGTLGVAAQDSFGLPMVLFGLLLGTTWAIGYTTAPMVVSALCGDSTRGRYIGYATGMIQVGFGLGPVLVGLGRHLGLSYPDCFRLAAALAALAAVVAGVLHLRSRELVAITADADATSAVPVRRSLAGILRSPAILPLSVIFLCACLFTAMNSFQSTYAVHSGLDYDVFYIGYTVAVIVARFALSPWLRDTAAPWVIGLGAVGLVVSTLGFLVVAGPVSYAVASVLLGATYGLTLPGVQARAVNVSDTEHRARVLPLAGMVFQSGILLFPLVAGLVIGQVGYHGLFVVLVVMAAAIAVFGVYQWIGVGGTHRTDHAGRAGRVERSRG